MSTMARATGIGLMIVVFGAFVAVAERPGKNPCAANPCAPKNPCAAAAAPAPAVKVGTRAPDFRLPSTTGGEISLSQFRGKKMVLVYFYSQDFNPT